MAGNMASNVAGRVLSPAGRLLSPAGRLVSPLVPAAAQSIVPASPQALPTPRLSRSLLSPLAAVPPPHARLGATPTLSSTTKLATTTPADASSRHPGRPAAWDTPPPRVRYRAAAALRVPSRAAAAALALVALAAVLGLAALSRGAAHAAAHAAAPAAAAPTSGAADPPAAPPSFVAPAQFSLRTDASAAPFAPFASDVLGVCPASPRAAATKALLSTTNGSVALTRLASPLSVGTAAAAAAPMRRSISHYLAAPLEIGLPAPRRKYARPLALTPQP